MVPTHSICGCSRTSIPSPNNARLKSVSSCRHSTSLLTSPHKQPTTIALLTSPRKQPTTTGLCHSVQSHGQEQTATWLMTPGGGTTCAQHGCTDSSFPTVLHQASHSQQVRQTHSQCSCVVYFWDSLNAICLQTIISIKEHGHLEQEGPVQSLHVHNDNSFRGDINCLEPAP